MVRSSVSNWQLPKKQLIFSITRLCPKKVKERQHRYLPYDKRQEKKIYKKINNPRPAKINKKADQENPPHSEIEEEEKRRNQL